MYKIESMPWGIVEPLWERWHTYDLKNPEPTVKIAPPVKVWVDLDDIMGYEDEKTLVFRQDNEPFGVLQVRHFISHLRSIAGIKNVAVKHEFRNNGIGRKLMEVANVYIKNNGFQLAMLYSSLYASQYGFYEKFGYNRHETQFTFPGVEGPRQVHLKFYEDIDLPIDELNQLIKDVGKF